MSELIPKGWDTKCLSEVCSFAIGGTPSRAVSEYWDSSKSIGQPWVSIRDLTSRVISETSEYITSEGIRNSNVKLVKKDTVLMSFKLSLGRVAIAGRDLYTNEAIAAFIPKSQEKLDNHFLYQGLQHWNLLENIDQAVKGVTLNKEKLGLIETLLPPLPEQQKIATILSSVDDVIEKTHTQIDKLKDLKTSMMQELLTQGIGHTEFKDSPFGLIPQEWTLCQMDDLFEFKNGVNKGKEAFGHGAPIISYKNVYFGGGIFDHQITDQVQLSMQELPRFSVEYGDVFFTRTSETQEEIGLTNVYLGNMSGVVFNGFVIRGRQRSERFDAAYLKYAFLAPAVRHQMIVNSKFTTRAGISGEALGKITLAVPSLVEQNKIAQILNAIDVRINAKRKNLRHLDSLKKALMQDLLTGKVRVKVDNPEVAAA